MGAGAVLHGTGGERDMEAMGGLIHRLPVTSVCFLIGAAAISALPPLNGFVSEWLLFQAILQSTALPLGFLRFLAPAVGGLMAPGGSACRRLLRARLRHRLPGPGPQRGGPAPRTRSRGPAQLAMGLAAAALLPARHLPRPRHRPDRRRWARRSAPRLPEQGRPGLAVAGAGEPGCRQLQRPGPVPLHRLLEPHRGVLRSPVRLGPRCGAPRPGTAAIPDPSSCHAVHGLELRPAAAAGLRRLRLPRPRGRSTCRRRARRGRRCSVCSGATSSGTASTHRWPCGLGSVTERLNALQFLTIRRYLSLVFGALVLLLLAW